MAIFHMSLPTPVFNVRVMGFERMRVYQAAQELDAEAQKLFAGIKQGERRGWGKDVDHGNRSLASILFNIPEAYGSPPDGKQRYHLEIARGEADEFRGVLRRLVANGFLTEKQIRRACELSSVIAKMLTAWIGSLPQ